MKKCSRCGQSLHNNATVCVNCGARMSKGKYAKKTAKKPFAIKLLLIIVIVIVVVVIGAILPQKKKSEVPNFCWDQVSNYSIINEESPDNVTVSIVAPDYAQLILGVILEDGESKIDSKALADAIKNNPGQQKEYIVTSSGSDEESIKHALMDQIAKELMIESIISSDYTEDWGSK